MSKTEKKYKDDQEATAALVLELEAIVPTLQVKTASASRAGRRVQARLTWTEPGSGKQGLGYCSWLVHQGKLSPVSPRGFADAVLRVEQRAARYVEQSREGGRSYERVDDVHKEALEGLEKSGCFSQVLQLQQEAFKKVQAVVRAGGHQSARRNNTQKRARETLASTLDFVLAAGISDDEVREMLKEALVRHTMES